MNLSDYSSIVYYEAIEAVSKPLKFRDDIDPGCPVFVCKYVEN